LSACQTRGVPPDLARHASALATVRAFAEQSGADRVVVLLDDGRGAAFCSSVGRADRSRSRTARGAAGRARGDRRRGVFADRDPARRAPSAMTADPETGEIHAPLGVVASLADGVLALARALGGRSLATAEFPTRDAGPELTIAAATARDRGGRRGPALRAVI
jgi:hypothetical protein